MPNQAIPCVASPLIRARETMELLREAMGLPPSAYMTEHRLMELSFGRWEGLTWSEIKAMDPWAADARKGCKWSFLPPEGESYAMLVERLKPWLESLAGDTLVVSHGGVARALMALIGGLSTASAPGVDIRQGRAILFEAGTWRWI